MRQDQEMNDINNNEDIIRAKNAISHLIDNCLSNFSIEELEEVKSRHCSMIEQQYFWLSQNNSERFLYELRTHGIWLCDFIAEVEKKFWGES